MTCVSENAPDQLTCGLASVDSAACGAFDGFVAACIQRSWRWSAVRDDLFGDPRLVAAGAVGLVLLATGIALESAALGTIGIIGAALVTASLVLPIVTKLTVGSVTFERAPTDRTEAITALVEEMGDTLSAVALWLSAGDRPHVPVWVRQALAVSYRDCRLVPRDHRDVHALCLLVRAVHTATGMDQAGRPTRRPRPKGDAPPSRILPADLADLPFEDRAALVLRRVAHLDDETAARVLHSDVVAFAAAADRAERAAARLRRRRQEAEP